ncbi:class F sortase [Streptomyces sp. NPDC006372]|uniref:class F sortase n=1 Tax=Streptomyces sp. NPDC006372 TaxID=3155599 RepID=UPI0033A2CB8A
MADGPRRLTTGLTVAAAALAAALGFPDTPSDRAGPPSDVVAASARNGTVPKAAPDARHRDEAGPMTAVGTAQDPRPRRVLVRDVGLDARVEPVGVTNQGDMAVPDAPSVAGWYRHGPAPGSAHGSAVLVGHVDTDTGDLGEFSALYDVRQGDRVEVRRSGAEPVRYRVVARVTVPKEELPPSAFRRTGSPVLTLITCAPPFVAERGGYLSNLVVTAEPVESRSPGNGRAR